MRFCVQTIPNVCVGGGGDFQFKTVTFLDETIVFSFMKPISRNWCPLNATRLNLISLMRECRARSWPCPEPRPTCLSPASFALAEQVFPRPEKRVANGLVGKSYTRYFPYNAHSLSLHYKHIMQSETLEGMPELAGSSNWNTRQESNFVSKLLLQNFWRVY
jgi:hypothetical protein